jgi:hypothetical protein
MFAGRYRLERQAPYEPSTQLPIKQGRQVAEANLRTAGLARPRDPPDGPLSAPRASLVTVRTATAIFADWPAIRCGFQIRSTGRIEAVDNGNSLQLSGFRRIFVVL